MKYRIPLYDVAKKLNVSIEAVKETLERSGYSVESVKDYKINGSQLNILIDVFADSVTESIIEFKQHNKFDKWVGSKIYAFDDLATDFRINNYNSFDEIDIPKVQFGFRTLINGIKTFFGYNSISATIPVLDTTQYPAFSSGILKLEASNPIEKEIEEPKNGFLKLVEAIRGALCNDRWEERYIRESKGLGKLRSDFNDYSYLYKYEDSLRAYVKKSLYKVVRSKGKKIWSRLIDLRSGIETLICYRWHCIHAGNKDEEGDSFALKPVASMG